jgi:flavin-dependent dehydrogenase
MKYDAIVLGAGPAGGTTALVLARAGFSVAVVEKAAFPRRKVCGEFMSATNAPLFAELGLSEQIDAMAGPEIHRVGLFAQDALVSAPMPKVKKAGSGWGRALGRDRLDALLLDHAVAAGAVALQPWSALRVRHEAGLGFCTIGRKGEERELTAPIIVAAHGSWERGALPTQITRPHAPSDLLGFKAHFRRARLAADLMPP